MICPLAFIHPEAKIGSNCEIGPFCYVDKNVVIGDNNVLMNSVTVLYGARISVGIGVGATLLSLIIGAAIASVCALSKKADFVIFNPYRNPKAVPMHNPVSTLVYSSTMENIESVAVDGEFVLLDGAFTTIGNEQGILRDAQRTAEDLCGRGGITNRLEGHAWRNPAP